MKWLKPAIPITLFSEWLAMAASGKRLCRPYITKGMPAHEFLGAQLPS